MHFRRALASLLFALCWVDIVTARQALGRRQDPVPSSAVSSGDQPPPSSSVTEAPQSTKDGSKPTEPASTKTQDHKITTTANANSTASKDSKDEELPIQPTLTPAMGVVGVVLIVTGVAYTIIGIKHEWLLVFLSTAYIASLGITVLVIYVMTPPVTDAVQGAYFVAAFMTGLIFGGFSLIFRDVTGGFGCLVGGFCMAMWFLCLKPDGLITDTIGKAIMIGVFSAAFWALAFSKYTRTWGIIFCTAFGGAMITIIGIDCFTRAGLKEFWIYIWSAYRRSPSEPLTY